MSGAARHGDREQRCLPRSKFAAEGGFAPQLIWSRRTADGGMCHISYRWRRTGRSACATNGKGIAGEGILRLRPSADLGLGLGLRGAWVALGPPKRRPKGHASVEWEKCFCLQQNLKKAGYPCMRIARGHLAGWSDPLPILGCLPPHHAKTARVGGPAIGWPWVKLGVHRG